MAPLWQDEEPQWGADEPEVVVPAAPAGGAPAGEKKEGEAGADGAPAPGEEAIEDPDAVDTRKFNKHWVRPKFLQYSYLYDYRRNYYDDVIDFMDRRSHGIEREIPRPQTWAERVLRTYNNKLRTSETTNKAKTDDQLIQSIHHTTAIQHYHSKNYYHKVFRVEYLKQ